ncbi:MAG: hypothetical protein AAB531_02120 [Patescibacteria group bacterium]|mgnify:CR=1 FL=1
MSIEQAFERGPLDRERKFSTHSHTDKDPYNIVLLEKGIEFLQETRAIDARDDLVEHVRAKYPDVKIIEPVLTSDHQVATGLRWNIRFVKAFNEAVWSELLISSRRVTRELGISVRNGNSLDTVEILGEEQWRQREILEDALVRGYQDPITKGSASHRI